MFPVLTEWFTLLKLNFSCFLTVSQMLNTFKTLFIIINNEVLALLIWIHLNLLLHLIHKLLIIDLLVLKLKLLLLDLVKNFRYLLELHKVVDRAHFIYPLDLRVFIEIFQIFFQFIYFFQGFSVLFFLNHFLLEIIDLTIFKTYWKIIRLQCLLKNFLLEEV